jgi:putative transcriptional regulator
VGVDLLAPATGRLLVATTDLVDPNFAQSVVLLLDHDDDGTLGVILNRPSDIETADVLPSVGAVGQTPPVVFAGGPVAPQNALAVGTLPLVEPDPTWFRRVFDNVGLVDVDALESGDASVNQVRIYAGYSGWSPGQLDDEIAEGAWFVLEAQPSDNFHPDPANLWRSVLRRQPPPLSYLVSWTPDPDAN